MPTCPYCNKELWYDEINNEYNDGSHVFQYWNGHCPNPNCSRNFSWTERYDFVDFYDLEEEKELE